MKYSIHLLKSYGIPNLQLLFGLSVSAHITLLFIMVSKRWKWTYCCYFRIFEIVISWKVMLFVYSHVSPMKKTGLLFCKKVNVWKLLSMGIMETINVQREHYCLQCLLSGYDNRNVILPDRQPSGNLFSPCFENSQGLHENKHCKGETCIHTTIRQEKFCSCITKIMFYTSVKKNH